MVKPAGGRATDGDIVDRVVDIRGIDAQRVKREADTRGIAHAGHQTGRDHQADCARNLGSTGEQDNLLGKGHPVGRDRQKAAGRPDMGDARDQINDRQQPAKDGPGAAVPRGHRRLLM